MVAKEIMAKKFETVLRGYKAEDVDEFLREVSMEFSRQQKEKEDLEKKLEVLADKIREYREDEDALKDALLGAQRQGNALIADSKRKAAMLIEETEQKVSEIKKKGEEEDKRVKEKSAREKEKADTDARKIINDANAKAKEVEAEMERKINIQNEILHRTTVEINDFRKRIINSYRKHIEDLGRFEKDCENDFIVGIRSDYTKNRDKIINEHNRQINEQKSISQENKVKTTSAKKEEEAEETVKTELTTEISNTADLEKEQNSIKFEIDVNEESADDKTIEINYRPEFNEDGTIADLEEFVLFNKDNNNSKKRNHGDDVFFKKQNITSSRDKQLQFGNNNE